MVRSRFASPFLAAALCLQPVVALAGDQDSTSFRIQDYIPDRITDFEWWVDGKFNMAGESRERPIVYYQDDPNRAETSDDNTTSHGQAKAASAWRYRYETRQGSFDCTFGIIAGLTRTNSINTWSTIDTLGLHHERKQESPGTDFDFKFPFSGEFRQYVAGDAFVAAVGNFEYRYYENVTKSIQHSYGSRADSVPGWFVSWNDQAENRVGEVNRAIDFTGEIRIGWGRVYEGKHAATAIYIIDELRRTGLLPKAANREDMLALSRLVHAYHEGHGPDTREYRAGAIQTIVSHLHAAGLLADESAAAILCIEDVLDFFPTTDRPFGWSVDGGFGGQDEYYSRQRESVYKRWKTTTRSCPDSSWILDTVEMYYGRIADSKKAREFAATDYVTFGAEYYRPLAARWQFGCYGRARLYLNKDTPHKDFSPRPGASYYRTVDKRELSASVSIRYLYDARTSFLVSTEWTRNTSVSRHHYFKTEVSGSLVDDITDRKSRFREFEFGTRIDYRFSPSTAAELTWSYMKLFAGNEHTDYEAQLKRSGFSLSTGITHWIF